MESAVETKSVSKSVSLPSLLWDKADLHAESNHTDRSSYIRDLIVSDLTAAGKLGNPKKAELEAVIADIGTEQALCILKAGARSALPMAVGDDISEKGIASTDTLCGRRGGAK